ncbi:MAG: cytidylate kinase-like family protein [Pyramidobacter sp.]|nr:cytidylate kinase-like family protein [Pyramidobacter sp.]
MSGRIVTISREYGSGGRTIGELTAEKLGVPFYDKVLIDMVAQKSGFAIDYIKNTEEKVTHNFLFNLAANGFYTNSVFVNDGLPASDNLFILQSKIIRELAEKGPCVIVGRCASYILRDRHDCLNVFIHAPLASRVKRAVEEYGIAAENAEQTVKRNDKIRAKHCLYYTGTKWGELRNYHASFSSDLLGCEGTASLIAEMAQHMGAVDSSLAEIEE